MAATLLCEVRADLDADLFSFPVIRGRILFFAALITGGGEGYQTELPQEPFLALKRLVMRLFLLVLGETNAGDTSNEQA